MDTPFPCQHTHPECSVPLRLLCLSLSDNRRREFLAGACTEIARATASDDVALLLREGEDALYVRRAEKADEGVELATIEGPIGPDLADREPDELLLALADALRAPAEESLPPICPSPPLDGAEAGSSVVFPLSVANQRVGSIALTRHGGDDFGEPDRSALEEVGRGLAGALLSRRSREALRERVKELSYLYELFRIAEQPGTTLDEVLQRAAEALPAAWQYPDIAHGKVCLDGDIYASPEGPQSVAVQRGVIVVDRVERGWVEVSYDEPRPHLDEGPFLAEERNLIEAIAHQLALIVQRRQAEEERVRLQEQLRHADRLATIGQLSAGVAHELNEPLANILGFAQLALRDEELPQGPRADVQNVVKASLHAREVIKKLMIFARQTPPQVAEADLNHVVEEGLYFLGSRCRKEGIDVVEDLAPGLPKLQADPSQLSQILVNLVVNAVQAMAGGGRLTVRTAETGPWLLLEVSDTGHGVPEDLRRKIFLPFYTTKDVDQGTGLGLSVVHGIVTAHGGTITVDSELGTGSTFRVRLPTAGPTESIDDE